MTIVTATRQDRRVVSSEKPKSRCIAEQDFIYRYWSRSCCPSDFGNRFIYRDKWNAQFLRRADLHNSKSIVNAKNRLSYVTRNVRRDKYIETFSIWNASTLLLTSMIIHWTRSNSSSLCNIRSLVLRNALSIMALLKSISLLDKLTGRNSVSLMMQLQQLYARRMTHAPDIRRKGQYRSHMLDNVSMRSPQLLPVMIYCTDFGFRTSVFSLSLI